MFTKVRSQKFEVGRGKRKVKSHCSFFLVLCSLFFSLTANAQCAMCRAALETEGNAVKSQAVNDGIVYLMVIPYLLVGGIGYYIYRMRKKKKQE
jgi:hypothetical protein